MPARGGIAVDQGPRGLEAKGFNRALHGEHSCPVNVDLVDLFYRGHADPNPGDLLEPPKDGLPRVEVQPLGIVDPARKFFAVENDRSRDHGSGERRATRLVHSRERLRKRNFKFETGSFHGC